MATVLLQREDIWRQIQGLDQKRHQRDLKQAVRSGLERLAFETDRDGMMLFLNGAFQTDGVFPDLFRISEIKRSRSDKGETVEVKYYNRFEAMAMLLQLSESDDSTDAMQALCQALQPSIEGE